MFVPAYGNRALGEPVAAGSAARLTILACRAPAAAGWPVP